MKEKGNKNSLINNVKSEETKNQITTHLLYLANSYFYYYKSFPCILHKYHVLQNLRKNKDMVITKPIKENGVVILDRKHLNSKKGNEDPTLK